MKKILIILPLIFAMGSAAFAQFSQQSSRSLFSDVKAYKEGDAIMILIIEDTEADNTAVGQESRETRLGGGLGLSAAGGGFDADLDLGAGNSFEGRGSTSRREKIRSRLSAVVTEVDGNGNLSIQGTRTATINGETQTISIEGKVRPVDVLPNNSVYSYSILDLKLSIVGEGTVSETQEPGLITKFLRLLF